MLANQLSTYDSENSADLPREDPLSLVKSLEMMRRLDLLPMDEQPELHPFIIQLQSKLTDISLNSNLSRLELGFHYFKFVFMISNYHS